MNFLASIDNAAAMLPPLWRIIAWGTVSGLLSMGIYYWLSPQQKIRSVKQTQKESRRTLKTYDGEWNGLKALIADDLALSLRQIRLVLMPFACSVIPLAAAILGLEANYPDPITGFGPEWMRGFEFWYILTVLTVSLALKIIFKID